MNEDFTNRAATLKDVEKLSNETKLLFGGTILVLGIGFLTLLFTVFTLMVDSSHFNSAVYQEYSAKMDTQNHLLEANKQLWFKNKELQSFITPTPTPY